MSVVFFGKERVEMLSVHDLITAKTQMNLKNAKSYFREHLCVGDYYAQGQQVRGHWFGSGAEMLGLSGVVTQREFLRLVEGLHPETGAKLTMRRNGSRKEGAQVVGNRRILFDFTISPPERRVGGRSFGR